MGLPFWPDDPATDRPDDPATDWPDDPATDRPDDPATDWPAGWAGTLAPERTAASLEVLASPVRLAVLDALHREGPLSYTALRTAAGVEDEGRFDYH